MDVGMIGAGRMGLPMARRLVEAGHDVRVLGRSAEKRNAITADGLRAVATVAEVAAEVVVVCVFTDEQVREICLDGELLAHLPRGATIVVHTTGNPRTVESIADHAAPHGIGVVDAPVSGGPHDVAAGRITLFTGGADDDVTHVRPVLDAYGDPVLHVGPLGSGQRVKLVNNALFAAQVGLVADAIRLGTELGVAEAVLLDALPHGSAASRALAGVAGRGSVAAFASTVRDFVSKDVAVVRTVVADLGSALGALDMADF
jgi:3-hydroxyisobutyrate dehydrogenase-like beta-hydroxyacid dehydrogenase